MIEPGCLDVKKIGQCNNRNRDNLQKKRRRPRFFPASCVPLGATKGQGLADKIEKIHDEILQSEYGRSYPRSGSIRVLTVYPNTYAVAMSNLAFQWLHHTLNTTPDFYSERVVLPDDKLAAIYQKQRTFLRPLESGTSARNATAWFVTLPFEGDYPNLVRLLGLARIHPIAAKRDQADPLIILGGTGPCLNPEPIAPMADLILLGEGDALLAPFLERLRAYPQTPDKAAFLASCADLPGAYVPRYYKPAFDDKGRRTSVATLKGFALPIRQVIEESIDQAQTLTHVLTPNTEFRDTLLIETFRGCTARCRFCAAGHLMLPPRPRDISAPNAQTLPDHGQASVGLVGAGVSGHAQIEKWIDNAAQCGHVGISSVRLNTLSDDALSKLARHGAKSVALAPEAGSERLRRVCNKPFSDEQIIDQAVRMATAGFATLKLYFLIGLPTETPADHEAIVDLTVSIRDALMVLWKKRKRAGTLTLSVNPFVPKARTPFQWAPFVQKTDYENARKTITNRLRKQGNVRVRFASYRQARVQALLSMGDRNVADLVLLLAKHSNEAEALRAWQQDPEPIIHRPRSFDEPLPWDFIDTGFAPKFLAEEYHRALAGKITPECSSKCRLCGICR